MAIELVGHDGKVHSSSTTTGFDSTGATLLVIIAHYWGAPAAYTFSDSYGNTWHQLTVYGSPYNCLVVIAYAYDKAGAALSLGANHLFTIADAYDSYEAITVSAWKGTLAGHVDPFYAENGGTFGSSPRQPGNLSAFAAGDLFISGCSEGNSYVYGPSIAPVTWTITDAVYDGSNMGGGHAYLLAPDLSAVNPTWTWTSSTALVANIATFKAEGGGGTVPPPGYTLSKSMPGRVGLVIGR